MIAQKKLSVMSTESSSMMILRRLLDEVDEMRQREVQLRLKLDKEYGMDIWRQAAAIAYPVIDLTEDSDDDLDD